MGDILKNEFGGGKNSAKSQGALLKKGEKAPPRDSTKAFDF
jgi:hypothetical protein